MYALMSVSPSLRCTSVTMSGVLGLAAIDRVAALRKMCSLVADQAAREASDYSGPFRACG